VTSTQRPQWQQPDLAAQGGDEAPLEGPVYSASGAALTPRRPASPPSIAETVVNTVAGVVWPVMIVLALMGQIAWWPAVLIALVTSVVLGNVSGHLSARRKALGGPTRENDDQEGMR